MKIKGVMEVARKEMAQGCSLLPIIFNTYIQDVIKFFRCKN